MDAPVHVDAVPLDKAVICVDCGMVTASENDCAVCGSSSVLSLSRILDRKEAA